MYVLPSSGGGAVTVQGGLSTSLPSLEGMDPGEWLAAVWRKYLELWPAILGLQHRAAELAATSTPGTFAHSTARWVVEAAGELSRIHSATVRKVEEYSGYLGLGAYPVAVAAAFSALALVVLWSFRRYDALERILDSLDAGTLTPEQATALVDSAGIKPDVSVLGGLTTGVLLGAVAVLGLLLYFRRRANPDLVLLENPDDVWSHEVTRLEYWHDDNGLPYFHDFKPGVHLQALEDGSVRLFHPRRPIWREF